MLSQMFEWITPSTKEESSTIHVRGDKVQSPVEDYEVYIAPDSGVFEYGPGHLKAVQAPTLNDGRAFADFFIDRQLEEQGINRTPIPLTRKKVV